MLRRGKVVNGYRIEAHANLTNASLYKANLSHANLSFADLVAANLSDANLSPYVSGSCETPGVVDLPS